MKLPSLAEVLLTWSLSHAAWLAIGCAAAALLLRWWRPTSELPGPILVGAGAGLAVLGMILLLRSLPERG